MNSDGLLDIVAADEGRSYGVNNQLFLNDGQGGYVNSSSSLRGGAHLTQGNAVADVNQDGHLDVLVVNMAGNFNLYGTNQMLINDGTGNFSVSELPSGSLYSSSVATVDIDNGNCDH